MTKISLPKLELEKFLALSSYTNLTTECIQLLPDTEYIKVDLKRGFCNLSLTSVSSFVTYMFSCQDQQEATLLISIIHLREFLKGKRKDIITIQDEAAKTIFSDGNFKLSKPKNIEIKIEYFTQIPTSKGLPYKRFNRDIILKLIQSKKYVELKDKLRPLLNMSSIKVDKLLATDGTISCFYSLSEKFDFEVLSIKEIDLISEFEYVDYCKTDNWNIIKYKTIVYGSRLTEGLNPGQLHETIEGMISILDKSKIIKVNVDQLYDFCNSIKSSHKDPTVASLVEVSSDGLILSYEDKQNSIEAAQPITATIIGYEVGYSFKIYQFQIMKVMDSLNSEWINISECISENGSKSYIGFWLDSDPSFHSICSKAI